MKVLLINPNYREIYSYVGSKKATPLFPPMGLAYIAAFLRQKKISVDILDANALNLTLNQIKEKIERERERDLEYVGITATTSTIEEANKIAKLCPSNIKVIVGGIHPSSLPMETLEEFQDFDIVVKGEGEYAMLDLVQNKPLRDIKGITFRENATIIDNPNRLPIKDLDSLPYPARDLLPMDKYFSAGCKKTPNDYILTSRGCPYGCIFCADYIVHGKKFRYRSPENIIKEIEVLVNKYKIKEFDIIDDDFTLLPDRVNDFCELFIKKKLNKKLIWRCSNGVRIDKLSLSLLKKMKEGGCYMLSLGIESGNERILKNIKKGITLDQARRAVKWCKQVGIETRGLFMLGNLGEDGNTMNDTIEFAKELDFNTVTFHITIPFPMTEYWKIIKQEGKLYAKNWVDYIAYEKAVFEHGNLTPELLLKMQRKAYHAYYLRPKVILKKILEINSFEQLKVYLNAAKSVLAINKPKEK